MTERTWEAEWRALAEKELRGAPLSSLTAVRHDGLVVPPVLGADAGRDEGLLGGPGARRWVVVTGRASDLALASGGAVWWRSAETPPEGAAVLLHERPGDPSTVELVEDRSACVAVTDVHERGGSAVTEVAIGTAAAIEIVRRRGGPPPVLRFAVAMGAELFVEIAKLRALRRLVGRAIGALGVVDVPVWVAARTSSRALARLDAPTNVVRGTIGVAAAMLGGADVVGALPMDADTADPTALAARVARNVPEILARESHLAAVDDPARGSFAIEALTDRIARDAWEVVREIERAGGLVAARALVRARISRDAEARRAAVVTRKLPLVGVSKHPRVEHAPGGVPALDDLRDAAPFERAQRGASHAVEIVVVGGADAVAARVDFVREVLAAGGLRVASAGEGVAAVVCAPDASFASEVPTALTALAARRVPAFVAGKPGAHESALRAAGARGFVALGQDVTRFAAEVRDAVAAGVP